MDMTRIPKDDMQKTRKAQCASRVQTGTYEFDFPSSDVSDAKRLFSSANISSANSTA